MVRTSVLKAMICAGLVSMMPGLAHAAGLGKLTVNSSLGQPLKAEIELVAVEKDELSAITARLASPAAYKEANLDRPSALSNIRFDVAQKSNGHPVLRINSTRTFNEPFVNLLIELTYPSGRLLREYTVLLDPQGSAEPQSFEPVGAPVVRSRTPARAARSETADSAPARTPSESAGTGAGTAGAGEGGYKVKAGDSLARIASEVKPREVSLEQAMTGIFANNKSAFVGGNMNRLRSGRILNIPQAEEMAAIDAPAAAREVKAHAADWNAYRQKLAAAVDAKPTTDAPAQQAASGKITTSTPDTPSPSAAPKDVLRLSKGEAGTAAGGKETAQLRDKVATLQEDAIARERTIKEANERIAALEKNLQEMRKLLELRNQNLADLQNQAARANTKPATPVTPPATPAAKAPVTPPAAVATPAAPAAPAATPAAPAVPAPAATATAPSAPAAPEPAPEPLVKALPDTPVTAPAATATPTPPAATTAPAPAKKAEPTAAPAAAEPSSPSLLDHIRDNMLMLAAIAIGALVLLLAALKVLSNRRRRSLATFEDSIMTGGDLKANTVFGSTQGGSIDTGDTSFLTDFSQAGMGTIDTNDVDPIAEAEVYMAYGRDAQAEEILKEAMSKDPNRHEIKLKLLEIYASRKNLIAFETLASELYAATGGKATPVWLKAAEMGRELDPDNPLYRGADGLPNEEPDTISSFAGNDSKAASPAVEPEIAGLDAEDAPKWDFPEDTPAQSNVVNFEKRDAADEFEFDLPQDENVASKHDDDALSALDADSIISQAYSRPTEPADAMQFDETPLDQQTIAPTDRDDMALDFSLPESDVPTQRDTSYDDAGTDKLDFDFNLDSEPAKSETAAAQSVDLSGIDLDLGKDDHTTASMDDLNFDDEFAPGQEVATKLDLAKAYMEMGDKEGAREILEEVMQEGDTQQKDDAKKLLAAVS